MSGTTRLATRIEKRRDSSDLIHRLPKQKRGPNFIKPKKRRKK